MNPEYKFDIYICCKIYQADELGNDVLDSNGCPIESKDCAVARQIYMHLREQDGNKRVFFPRSSSVIMLMAENNYEEIIHSAIESAKLFILIAGSRMNVESHWVRTEWQRYLEIMKNDSQQHEFVIVGNDISISDLPAELRNYTYIDFDNAFAPQQFDELINKTFNK